jgi:hypothetical protein
MHNKRDFNECRSSAVYKHMIIGSESLDRSQDVRGEKQGRKVKSEKAMW